MQTSYRRINFVKKYLPQLIFMVGVFLIQGINSPTASALELPSIDSPLKVNIKKLDEVSGIIDMYQDRIEQKKEQVKEVLVEVKKTDEKAEELTVKLHQLQEQVLNLDDMFVHVTKNAPSSGGNAYAPGNCTWYVKQKRPDIGSFWGNASAWYYSAQLVGYNVGSRAKIGAIAVSFEGWAGHVAYVEKVSVDGMWVTISEMNYGGLYMMNTRTVPYTSFKYIYEMA